MRPHFDAIMSANMVAMMRADVDGAIWIVDDETEGRFYEGAAHEHGRVVPAFGAAADVLETVSKRGVEGVLGVTNKNHSEPSQLPLYRPSIGDVASILLIARSADRVLGEVGGAAWLTACGREIGAILPWAVKVARGLEALIDGDIRDDICDEAIDWNSAELKWNNATDASRVLTGKSIPLVENLELALVQCNGLTAIRVLAAATRRFRPRGIQAYRGVKSEELASLLRAAFDLEEFERDGLFWKLKQWQWANRRYSLFRPWRRLEPFGILLDHRYFEKDLEFLAGNGSPFAALQLDLDHFKNVNDQLGHIEGDEAIRIAERTLLAGIGGQGEAYRRGGDELVALLVGVSREEAERAGEQLRSRLEQVFAQWAGERSLTPAPTASVGVVHVSGPCSATTLLARTEQAQLDAKRGGKNTVVCCCLPETPSDTASSPK